MNIAYLNECKNYLKIFIEHELGNDINKLKDFHFNNLNKSSYNIRGINFAENTSSQRHEDSTFLARLIYCIVWGDWENNPYALPDLVNAHESFGISGNYGGETINNYSSIIDKNKLEPISQIFTENENNLISLFREKYLTIGNFMPMPKIRPINESQTINQIKGCRYNDLADKFYYYYLFQNTNLNSKDFCTKNFLKPFFDTHNNYAPKIIFKYNNENSIPTEDNEKKKFILYFAKKATNIIDYRAQIICNILKERL